MKNIIDAYASLITRSIKTSLGRSYYHVSQPEGKHFVPGGIKGYFNDFTKKTDWTGESDDKGIPVNVLSNEKRIYFPITIAQMALGHYDLWLENNNESNKESFLKLAHWLKDNQDELGGWTNPWEYLRPLSISNYSAMAQGEAISVMIRAHLITNDSGFVDSSFKAFHLMMKPLDKGGCAYYSDQGVYLEECPENPRTSVLNGWIYSALGIYDLMLFTKDDEVTGVFDKTIDSIELSLDAYDMGYWSYYDLQGLIASPFYHNLHITLLDTLYKVTDIDSFKTRSEKWSENQNNTVCRTKALGMKVLQRFKDPALVTLIK